MGVGLKMFLKIQWKVFAILAEKNILWFWLSKQLMYEYKQAKSAECYNWIELKTATSKLVNKINVK